MECRRRLALWCSVALFIASIVLLSLYFSCMNICIYQQKSYAAPLWTAALGILVAIFGFVISSKKLKDIWRMIFAASCVICMISALACIYLVIGALISEIGFREEGNMNYMTAMFIWVGMLASSGVMFVLATIETCGYLCCCHKTQDENANAMAAATWANPTQNAPVDFIRDPPPPYSPPATEGLVAPTAPPLFLSATLQREQGMPTAPSADRRSFSANLAELSELSAAHGLVMNEYTEMNTFAGEDQSDSAGRETNGNNTKMSATNGENAANSGKIAINCPETMPESSETVAESRNTIGEGGQTAARTDDTSGTT